MKITRNNTFETNSSSTHSYVYENNDSGLKSQLLNNMDYIKDLIEVASDADDYQKIVRELSQLIVDITGENW